MNMPRKVGYGVDYDENDVYNYEYEDDYDELEENGEFNISCMYGEENIKLLSIL